VPGGDEIDHVVGSAPGDGSADLENEAAHSAISWRLKLCTPR
jgi:hypothetical protein